MKQPEATNVCRQTKYVRRTRAELIELLGGRCVWPGCGTTENLEFDHINGRSYDPRKLSSSARMARYKREARAGELRLLCDNHNLEARAKNDNGRIIRTEHKAIVPRTNHMEFASDPY